MGERQLQTDPDMIAEVDLHENAVYVVCQGKLQIVDTPPTGYGTQLIYWREGKPTHSEIGFTQKFG
ncbi:DUF3954 domain-containing protein [Rummeliibacillus sp. POC4]|uniref:DUF3954 domain-containing protein n=1 Tax=Rummeliibacillus sp. POC4 TaxID=2305899 RepID=UPI000E66B5C0|nr:DUF3954 domain-containing protein [Rummeliibacillus sp. POC4]RIJ63622.1 DUF3954 domain-containing protein [Rummeliibacillus sp. POC4]